MSTTPVSSSSPLTAQAYAPVFTEYRFTVWRPNQYNFEKITPRSSKEEMELIQSLSNEIEELHQYAQVWIELATPPPKEKETAWSYREPPPPPLPPSFHEHFTVSGRNGRYLIGPKILRETTIDNSMLKRIEYANGVIEESKELPNQSADYDKRKGARTFPDGRVEKGIFEVCEKNSFQGVRSKKDCKDVYVQPESQGPQIYYNHETKKLISSYELDEEEKARGEENPGHYSEVKLAAIEGSEGGERLALLICENEERNEYTHLNIPLFEVLLTVGKFPSYFGLSKLMKYIVDPNEFISFLLSGDRPIMNLSSTSLLEVLKLAKKLEFPINLHQVDEKTQETLFSKYAASKSSTELIQYLLEMDSSAIDQIQTLGKKRSFVSTSLLNGNDKVANLLLEAAEKRGIPITLEDRWILRAYKNDTSFIDEEFKSLSAEFQEEIYGIANTFNCYELCLRLRGLIGKAEDVVLLGPSLFTSNMDCAKRKEVAEQFLVDLRKKGRLLTSSEYAIIRSDDRYWDKESDIGRFLGCNYIEAVAAKLGLKRIKVPIIYAELRNGKESISVKVRKHEAYLGIDSFDLQIWSKNVSESRNYATYEEMVELVDFLEESCFWDIHPANFVIAQDGIYLIDMEFTNFTTVPAIGRWDEIIPMCEPDSRKRFVDYMNAKLETIRAKQAAPRPTQMPEAHVRKFGLASIKPMIITATDVLNSNAQASSL